MTKREKWPSAVRLSLLATLLLALASWRVARAAAIPPDAGEGRSVNGDRPNVMLVVLDDIGYSDLGCYGGEIHTPSLDGLAAHGLRYLKFDTNAVCSATRASLLTGRNSTTVKMESLAAFGPRLRRLINQRFSKHAKEFDQVDPGWRDPKDQSRDRGWMPRNAETLAQVFKEHGYATWAIGKWHLAPQWENGAKGDNIDFPLQRGFEYFYGYRDGWTDQYHPTLYHDNQKLPIPVYAYGHMLTGDLINHAIAQMKSNSARHPGRPFFLYLALSVAHAPVQVTPPYIDAYDGVYDRGWDAIRADRFAREKLLGVIPRNAVLPPRNPGDPPWSSLTPMQKRVYARFMQTYAGYITYGDQQIGRLLQYMRTNGVFHHTLIVVLSDNGPAGGGGKHGGFFQPYLDKTTVAEMNRYLTLLGGPRTEPLYPRGWAMAGATPYRRYKLWPYLGGVRDDLIVSWPGRIKNPGSTRDQYVHAIDVAPTLLAAAGLHFDSEVGGMKEIPIAGRSFLKSLTHPDVPSARTVQYFLLMGNRAITHENWRAVAMHRSGTAPSRDRWELFNLSKDPTEAIDVAKEHPAKLRAMQSLWRQQAKKYGGLPLYRRSPFWFWGDWHFADAFAPNNRYDY